VRDHVTNIRLGMFLEMSTVAGALTGAIVSGYLAAGFLRVFFGALLAVVAVLVIWDHRIDVPRGVVGDRIAKSLRLGGQYHDYATGQTIQYEVTRTPITFSLSYFAGIVSGLLGVGGGVVKVPAMNLVSRVPVKVASATSNFMIGVTAAASATVYLSRGQVYPLLVAPLMLGVVIGAALGTRILHFAPPRKVKAIFGVLLVVTSILLILRGLGVHV
ncbi:MAG TPA: sulfite exporter TauE/SafE family protein, partial [Candidatus Binatus sp.]|nr:sulfite exporter TauE/SafE family protein [Candidatus Binatus sp.]